MPAQTYDALLRSLPKGELAPVYYLHGPENILKDEAVEAIVAKALDPALRDFNFDQRSAGQLDPEAIFTTRSTRSSTPTPTPSGSGFVTRRPSTATTATASGR